MNCISIAPKTLEELNTALSTIPSNNIILGGGTDIVIKMRNRGLEPEAILYLGNIPEMKEIKETESTIEIGAGVTMTDAEDSPLVREKFTALYYGAKDVGSKQIRNKGTLVGNIATASPAGDIVPIMFLYDARVEITGPQGKKTLAPIDEVLKGKGKINLAKNEVITKLILPKHEEDNFISAFHKLGSRRSVTISRIGMAVSANFNKDRTLYNARVYMGAISPTPMRVKAAESILNGSVVNQEVKDKISDILFYIIEDITPKGYERHDEQYYKRHYRYYKPYSVRGVVEDTLDLLSSLY
ncbi:FAD binding domain-containing protein [Peptoniphilus catoniae]|uniref:FAD binding domain-containing protein n=1 Tax=Peptoniphilus catoniae TaxID=1660341 RepID=UPI0010FE1E73|nr:FAD binding domain-containing protein [Peptoniphilus catoniae]